MKAKRLALLSIVALCLILLILSMAGFWQRGAKTSVRRTAAAKKAPGAAAQERVGIEARGLKVPYTSGSRKMAALYLPRASEGPSGESWIGENGTLTLYREELDKDGNPKTIIVRFVTAETSKVNRMAELRTVEVELESGITLKTSRVFWDPWRNIIHTDAEVTVTGKEITARGMGMEADTKAETAVLRKDVTVTLQTAEGLGFSGMAAKEEAGPPKRRELVITCEGELSIVQRPVKATFNKAVHVKSAESRLNCDILELQFTGESVTPDGSKGAKEAAKNPSPFYGAQGPGEVERIIAKGNVTFKDELSQGAGDNMVWEADRRVATLKGRPATATQDKNTVTAEALVFSQEQKSLSVPCKGDLVFWTKGEVGLMPAGTTSPKQPKTDVPTPMRVTWNKDMSYTASKAVFNDRVRAEQGQNWLTSEVLEVSFDDQNRLKGALATGPVTIRHEGRQAFGNRLEWSADAGEAWLTGEPRAEVREGESFIGCPKLGFLRDKDRIEAVGSGYLVAVPKPGPPQPGRPPATPLPGQDPNAKIRVTWAERMDFNLGRHTATFHKDVHAGREDLKIAANEMQVVFDDSNQKISKLVADDPKGDLRLEHPQGTGRGTHAEWNALDETAGIFGEPRAVVMMEAGRRLEAPKIFANTQTQAVHTEGGGVFTSPQKSDEKQAKTQAMALNDEANVEWSDTLDFDKAAQEAIFKGNVRARAGDKSIASDVLRLDFSGTDKKMELKRVLAEGHVALSQTSQQGAGERFAWDAGSDEATLEGNPARAGGEAQGYEVAGPVIKILRINQPKQDILVNGKGTLTFAKPLQGGTGKGDQVTITWNDKFIFERSAGKGVFTGGATVSQGARKVRSDRIEVLLDQQEQIEVVRAIDNVAVEDTQEYQEATGASLDWFKSDDKAVLTGAPDATIWFGSRDGSARTRTQAQRIVFLGFFFDERKEGEQAKRGRKVTFEGPVSFNASGE